MPGEQKCSNNLEFDAEFNKKVKLVFLKCHSLKDSVWPLLMNTGKSVVTLLNYILSLALGV